MKFYPEPRNSRKTRRKRVEMPRRLLRRLLSERSKRLWRKSEKS